jgi:hypothetical protein
MTENSFDNELNNPGEFGGQKLALSGFEPTAVRGKWFEVNDLNHSAKDAPCSILEYPLISLFKFYHSASEMLRFIK